MRKFLIFAAALLMPASASATVTYEWAPNAIFTVDEFLTGSGTIAQSDTDSCLPSLVTVYCEIFFIDAGAGDTFDELGISYSLGPGILVVPILGIFPDGSFTASGYHFDLYYSSILWVTENDPVVPEPTTWITMLAGFAAVGFAFRRRRAAFQRKSQLATHSGH